MKVKIIYFFLGFYAEQIRMTLLLLNPITFNCYANFVPGLKNQKIKAKLRFFHKCCKKIIQTSLFFSSCFPPVFHIR